MSANIDTPTPDGQVLADAAINRVRENDGRLQNIILLYVQNFVPEERWNLFRGRYIPEERHMQILRRDLRPRCLLDMFREYFGAILGLASIPLVGFDTDPGATRLPRNTAGRYDGTVNSGNGNITVNDNILDEKYDFVSNMAHEMFHDYQTERAAAWLSRYRDEVILEWNDYKRDNPDAEEFAYYQTTALFADERANRALKYGRIMSYSISNNKSVTSGSSVALSDREEREYAQYQEQPHEVDARYFSAEFMTIFRPRFETQEIAERERLRAAEMEEKKLLREKKRIERHHLKMYKNNLKEIEEMIKEEDMKIRKIYSRMT